MIQLGTRGVSDDHGWVRSLSGSQTEEGCNHVIWIYLLRQSLFKNALIFYPCVLTHPSTPFSLFLTIMINPQHLSSSIKLSVNNRTSFVLASSASLLVLALLSTSLWSRMTLRKRKLRDDVHRIPGVKKRGSIPKSSEDGNEQASYDYIIVGGGKLSNLNLN